MCKRLLAPTFGCCLVGMSITANAADIVAPPPPAPVVYSVPSFNWSGLYIGANVGGAWNLVNITDSLFGLNFDSGTAFSGGGQIGFNYQSGVVVLGVEGDFDFAANERIGAGVATPLGNIQATSNSTVIATLAGRIGIAHDRWLFYGKAGGGWIDGNGFAINNATTRTSISDLGSNTNLGWLAGAGIEWALVRNLTLKIEYDYLGLNGWNFTVPTTAPFLAGDTLISSNHNIQAVQVGFNYIFNSGD